MGICYQKVLVTGTMNLVAISCGFTYGHLTNLVRSLQKAEDRIELSDGQMSIIATSLSFSGIVAIALLGLGESFGRRWNISLYSMPLLVNWVILYYAHDYTSLLLSRILGGLAVGALSILNIVIAAEFASPKFRAISVSFVSLLSPGLGRSLGHILGIVVNWRALCILGFVISVLHVFLPFFWIESPQWLARQGRFEDCRIAFKKLHGNDPKNDQELDLLMKIESNKLKKTNEINKNSRRKVFFNLFKNKYFYNIMLTNCIIYTYYSAAGKVIFDNLATVILEQMTGTSDILLFTIIVDAFIIIGTSASILIIKKLPVRVLLFSTGLIANGLLLTLSACLYFKNDEKYFQWINVTLLAVYFITIHAGPYPVLNVLLGEIFPLDIKMFCFLLSTPALAATCYYAMILMPVLVNVIGYHGLFLSNSVVVFFCLWYFWAKMPETKGKTLQEIELYFKNDNCDVHQVMDNEQIKNFI